MAEESCDEKELICEYFKRGFKYEEICMLMEKHHAIRMSIETLKRRLKDYGLKRRNADFDVEVVRQKIRILLDGPDCMGGYRHVWHTLQMEGVNVPCDVVQQLLRELDPQGSAERRAHSLKRRTYHNIGPNFSWHADGYDKLKPIGLAIHGCIDGWSRKILWLYVTRSNNSPHNIATYYLDAIQKYGGCPVKLVTDLGTENGIMASLQCFFRDDLSSHTYVPSPRNQRIEGWWSYFRRSRTTWWINFFKDLEEQGLCKQTVEVESECLWFCFAALLQQDIDQVREHWNTHVIRRSKFDTIAGRPDSLYYLTESHGGVSNLVLPVADNEMEYARLQVIEPNQNNDYQDYFQYVMTTCELEKPVNWRGGLVLYHTLLSHAKNGS